jgi:hypothetical protein
VARFLRLYQKQKTKIYTLITDTITSRKRDKQKFAAAAPADATFKKSKTRSIRHLKGAAKPSSGVPGMNIY